MAKVIVGTTMSLDGFMNDREGSVNPLYSDFDSYRDSDLLQESIRNTGAVVMGRKTFAMADDPDWFAGNYEFQVPIFVLCHTAPATHPKETETLRFTFVTDGVESATRQARAAANDKDVTVVGGANTAQQILRAGLADELHIDIMPVLLKEGLRFFENLDGVTIQLEKIGVDNLGGRTSLRFRVVNLTR